MCVQHSNSIFRRLAIATRQDVVLPPRFLFTMYPSPFKLDFWSSGNCPHPAYLPGHHKLVPAPLLCSSLISFEIQSCNDFLIFFKVWPLVHAGKFLWKWNCCSRSNITVVEVLIWFFDIRGSLSRSLQPRSSKIGPKQRIAFRQTRWCGCVVWTSVVFIFSFSYLLICFHHSRSIFRRFLFATYP